MVHDHEKIETQFPEDGNIDSRITGKKILIHDSRKEKTPIHRSQKKYRGPSIVTL